jgi:formylglycine-generating enzyme required for sulfatase activity
MLPDKYQWIDAEFEPVGDPRQLFEVARELESAGNLEGAATAYDRAYGLDPTAADVRTARARVLDELALVEHGLHFRFIPGGAFLMGNDMGDSDERPQHPVLLSPYWLSKTPVSWAAYCRLMDWDPPPGGQPRSRQPPSAEFDKPAFHLHEANKIRLQYCEDHTTAARDWHAHLPGQTWESGGGTVSSQELFGAPWRDEPDAPWQYDSKPMVAVAWQDVDDLSARLSTARLRYSLPTEAQWEKAARGGLIGARYAWGDATPTHDVCDFDRFREFSIRPMKSFPANGYGLYAVNGGVWEWTRDWYDRDYYRRSPRTDPEGPEKGQEKVLRGGSWADCGQAISVTFRASRGSQSWTAGEWAASLAPNIGFRLCRTVIVIG